MNYRILDADGEIHPTDDVMEWARNQDGRHWVRRSDVGGYRVVTIFEGIEVVPSDVRLFATAVITGPPEATFRVHSEEWHDTQTEALAYHERIRGEIEAGIWNPKKRTGRD
jgi:hypothetical protein